MYQNDSALAEVISQARKAKGLSTRAVAAEIGIDQSNLVRLEAGNVATPKPAVLTEIARILDLDAADLYALAGYTMPSELPAFTPYLRSKFADLPPEARKELEQSFARIANKYGYDANGPTAGEDEH
jgi:transcriptional regulator with XRE-family HTH domain